MKRVLVLLLVIAMAFAAPQRNPQSNRPATESSSTHPANTHSPSAPASNNNFQSAPVANNQFPSAGSQPAFAPQPSPFGVNTGGINAGLSQGIGSVISSAFGSLTNGFSG